MSEPVTTSPGPLTEESEGPPSGLEYLNTVDQLILSQKVDIAETFIGFESANKYTVKNGAGQHVFWGVEESGALMRNCCSYLRAFTLRVMDSGKREVFQLRRPLRCQGCWFPCWLQQLEVTAGDRLLGSVLQDWSLLRPSFRVCSPDGSTAMLIRGPAVRWGGCCGSDFEILSADGSEEVGFITKTWAGLAKEVFTDTDRYGICFPEDLGADMKAVLMGAAFLIDFMFFESSMCRSDCGCCMIC